MRLTLLIAPVLFIIAGLVLWNIVRRRQQGREEPGTLDGVVRCSQGHLFTTLWVAGASSTLIRVVRLRYQHCPVGHYWSTVEEVPARELSDAQFIEAALLHDIRIP